MEMNSANGSLESICDSNVIIVGAGLSGLTAAYKLLQRDESLRVIVLEAKDRIGGRVYSLPLRTSRGRVERYDFGGQWVNSLQPHILALAQDLDLEIYPQYHFGMKVGQAGLPIWRKLKDYPVFGPWYCRYEMYQFIIKIENMAKKVSLSDPLSFDFAKTLDGMTMETMICQSISTVSARDIARAMIQVIFGTEPSDISALFFLTFCNGSCGFMNQFVTTSGGAREFRIKGGAQQVAELLVEKIGPQYVLLEEPVIEMKNYDDCVYITTASKRTYRTEYVIMAIPPGEVTKIKFTPQLPLQHRKLLQRMPAGHFTKFVVTYERPFWRDIGYSGELLTYGGVRTKSGDKCPISMIYDVTTEKGGAALMGCSSGKTGIQWSDKKEEYRKQSILESLSTVWGPSALEPLDYKEINWSNEEYVGGCPTHIVTPGVMSWLDFIRAPHLRIHWAGTETATQWCGFMEGAVQAGHRAAIEVLYELRPQSITHADLDNIKNEFGRMKPVSSPVPEIYRHSFWIPVTAIVLVVFLYARHRLSAS